MKKAFHHEKNEITLKTKLLLIPGINNENGSRHNWFVLIISLAIRPMCSMIFNIDHS